MKSFLLFWSQERRRLWRQVLSFSRSSWTESVDTWFFSFLNSCPSSSLSFPLKWLWGVIWCTRIVVLIPSFHSIVFLSESCEWMKFDFVSLLCLISWMLFSPVYKIDKHLYKMVTDADTRPDSRGKCVLSSLFEFFVVNSWFIFLNPLFRFLFLFNVFLWHKSLDSCPGSERSLCVRFLSSSLSL